VSKSKRFYAYTPKAKYFPITEDPDDGYLYLKPIYLKSRRTRRKSVLTRNKVKRDIEKLKESFDKE
jgi:hypothetical protein